MKDNPQKFWRSVSHIKGKSRTMDTPHSVNDFNQHFLNIASNVAASLDQCGISPDDVNYPSFELKPVEVEEVESCLKFSKVGAATGTENIPMRFLKACRSFLAINLLVLSLTNLSLNQLYQNNLN